MQRIALVLAAATVTGIGIAATNAAVNVPTTEPAAVHSSIISTHKAMTPSNDAKIDSVLAKMTDYALSPGHMDHLVSLLDQASRHRLMASSTYKQNFGKPLDAEITRISDIWKTKYGQELKVDRAQHALSASFATVQTGTVSKDARLASQVMADEGHSTLTTPAKAGLASNEWIALADVKSADGLSDLHVAMACKSGGTWKIVAPQSLTAEKLRANLQAEFAAMTAPKAKWPASEAEAYRDVAHRVLLAILNEPAPAQKQAAATSLTPAAPVVGHSQQASAAPVQSSARPASTGTSHWWQFWRW